MNIHLGHDAQGRPVIIPEKALATHLHILGSTGTGKSKALEHILRQLIMSERGLCLIEGRGVVRASAGSRLTPTRRVRSPHSGLRCRRRRHAGRPQS